VRKKIPKVVQDHVKHRQKNTCVCCLKSGGVFHHLKPVSLGGDNSIGNIFLLCSEHHSLVHLGDLETIKAILEYSYFLQFKEVPENLDHELELFAHFRKQNG
jgi:hypothetical protein